jgi:aminopeptidase-like protein
LNYKKSRRGNAEIDRAFAYVLKRRGDSSGITEFSPYGYDERQFCSPGFNLPVGRLSRAPFGEFPEYHTSADNLDFVTPASLEDTVAVCAQVLELIESNHTYRNLSPKCEPQLGKRGLYRSTGGSADGRAREMAMLWILNLSDGDNSLLDIAERSGIDFTNIRDTAQLLAESGLLQRTIS